jgi:hypothetical protein
MTISLYSLSAEFQALYDRVAEAAGELTPEVEAAFDALGLLEADKVDAYQHVIAEFTAHAAACQSEIERLQEKQQHALDAKRRLTERLKEYMEEKQVKELKGDIWKAVIQKNGGKRSLTITASVDDIPPSLMIPAWTVNTEAIRNLMGDGDIATIDGREIARLEPAGTHLRFR